MLRASMWMSSRPRREASTNSPSRAPCYSIRSSSGQPPALACLSQLRAWPGWPGIRHSGIVSIPSAVRAACAAPRPPAPAPGPHLVRIVCPRFNRRAFGRERSALRRFLPAALTEAESDEVDISAPGFGAWPSAEPWAEAIAALEGHTLEEVQGAEVVGAGSPLSSPDQSAERIAVECTRCRKWRLVNKGEGAEEEWQCALNNDPAYNTCQVAQEMSNAEMDAYLGLSQNKRGGGGGGSKRTPASERERLGLPAEVGFSMRATVDKRRIEHGGERYATIQERLPPTMRKAGWYVTPQMIWPSFPMPQCPNAPMPQCHNAPMPRLLLPTDPITLQGPPGSPKGSCSAIAPVAASVAYGCSIEHIRLQVRASRGQRVRVQGRALRLLPTKHRRVRAVGALFPQHRPRARVSRRAEPQEARPRRCEQRGRRRQQAEHGRGAKPGRQARQRGQGAVR